MLVSLPMLAVLALSSQGKPVLTEKQLLQCQTILYPLHLLEWEAFDEKKPLDKAGVRRYMECFVYCGGGDLKFTERGKGQTTYDYLYAKEVLNATGLAIHGVSPGFEEGFGRNDNTGTQKAQNYRVVVEEVSAGTKGRIVIRSFMAPKDADLLATGGSQKKKPLRTATISIELTGPRIWSWK